MSLDFTLTKYEELMRCLLNNGYAVSTVAAYLSHPDARPGRCVVLRHDVDRMVDRALAMARLEHRVGVCSTYYFRMTRGVFKRDAITDIVTMGHEVGYHYEVMDRAKGDPSAAKKLFVRELAALREMADVRTCAMHGNPLTKWDNRDLWKSCSWEDFGLLGEAYLSFRDVTYLSDTGRTWSRRSKVKDRMIRSACGLALQPDVHSTDDLIAWLRDPHSGSLCLTVHPERWQETRACWFLSTVRDTAVNSTKRVMRMRNRFELRAHL